MKILFIQDDDAFTLNDLKIFILLFADDTVLISYTPHGLQNLIDQLQAYCTKWGITVNTDKTVVMVFKQGNRVENIDMYYNGKRLNVVAKFTYLGVTISSNGNFYQAQKSLADQGSRALFSLFALFDKVEFDITDKINLIDSMICPILNYGSEIWGFHKSPDVEKVHIKFLKRVLRLNQNATSITLYGECGRFPLNVIRKIKSIKYWFKISTQRNTLMYKFLCDYLSDESYHANSWFSNIKNLLNDLGFHYLWNNTDVDSGHISTLVQRVYDQYLQQWNNYIKTSS